MTNPERAEAARVAGAMIGCALSEDTEGARALVDGSSRYVLGRALDYLAHLITTLIPEDRRDSALAEITGLLQNFADDDEDDLGPAAEGER